MVEGEISLIFGNAVRQIWRSQNSAFFPQMILIPRQRVVIERVSAENFLRGMGIEQVVHEEDIVHILFVKYCQIMDFFLVRKEVLNLAE